MRWVESAPTRPQHCAVLPYIGSFNSQRGFIDTGAELPGFDNHVYVSVLAVEQMASMIGWAPAVEDPRLEQAQARVAELEAERDELKGQLAAIGTLKLAGATTARPVGRPKKAVA